MFQGEGAFGARCGQAPLGRPWVRGPRAQYLPHAQQGRERGEDKRRHTRQAQDGRRRQCGGDAGRDDRRWTGSPAPVSRMKTARSKASSLVRRRWGTTTATCIRSQSGQSCSSGCWLQRGPGVARARSGPGPGRKGVLAPGLDPWPDVHLCKQVPWRLPTNPLQMAGLPGHSPEHHGDDQVNLVAIACWIALGSACSTPPSMDPKTTCRGGSRAVDPMARGAGGHLPEGVHASSAPCRRNNQAMLRDFDAAPLLSGCPGEAAASQPGARGLVARAERCTSRMYQSGCMGTNSS